MQQVTEKGIKIEDIRRVYKVLADEDFPQALVHRLVNNSSQLLELYGTLSSADNLLKVLRFLSDSKARSDGAQKAVDGCEIDLIEEALFELPEHQDQFADGADILDGIDGLSVSDQEEFELLRSRQKEESEEERAPPADPLPPDEVSTLQLVGSVHGAVPGRGTAVPVGIPRQNPGRSAGPGRNRLIGELGVLPQLFQSEARVASQPQEAEVRFSALVQFEQFLLVLLLFVRV